MAKSDREPDSVEEWFVSKMRMAFREWRSLAEKGLQANQDDNAKAVLAPKVTMKRNSVTGDYDFEVSPSMTLPLTSASEKVRIQHGRFEMIQGEMFND